MSYQQEKFTEIADAIRGKTGESGLIKPSDFKDKIGDVYDKGASDFLDGLVNYGNRVNYQRLFNEASIPILTLNYPINLNSGAGTADLRTFYNSKIKEIHGTINLSYPFQNVFSYCYDLETIDKIVVSGTADLSVIFSGCTKLKNLVIEGETNKNVRVEFSPLTKASIDRIVAILSDEATDKTVTLKQTAVEAAYTTAEWEALIATKPNWTFSLI